MRLHPPSDLLLASPPASPFGLHWPAWCLRIALGWTELAIERVRSQLADDFASESQAPMYRELELLNEERDRLLARLGRTLRC